MCALILAAAAQLVLHGHPRTISTTGSRRSSGQHIYRRAGLGSAQRIDAWKMNRTSGKANTVPVAYDPICKENASRIDFGPLQLNRHARKTWSECADADSVRAVFLTFGSHSMADFLLNWVKHVRKIGQRLYLVGALDSKMASLCDEHGISAATISDDVLRLLGVSKLGARAATTYYRYAPGTFLRMGLIKQVFIRQVLLSGLDAMVSDVDVVWFRSPWPLVRYGNAKQPSVRANSRLLALADVVLSVDQVQQYMDSDKHQWHIGSELNTGVVFFRNSPGAMAVLDEWRVAMTDAIARGNPNHDQYWLNEVLRPRDFYNLKFDHRARGQWFPAARDNIISGSALRGRYAPDQLPTDSNELSTPTDPDLRALYLFKRRFGQTNSTVTIGTFPIAEISNGHTFFVQKLHSIVGVPPVCVHTTYQYGDATTYAFGKRERLRDEHLWLLDEEHGRWNGRFLRLTSAPARLLAPMHSELVQPEAIDPKHCVRSHLKLMMLQRQWLMDGFLLAKALDRILVLPPLWCMLDRFWTILNRCLIGSQVEMPQPFVCPLDHSFELPLMMGEVEWREHSFFSNPLAPAGMLDSAIALSVGATREANATSSQLHVPEGSTFAEAVGAIRADEAARAAKVVSIDSSDMAKLCRCLVGLPEVHGLAERLPRILSHTYHYCDTTDNPYFVDCKKHGRQGCRKHKVYLMNVSRGLQAPPAIPLSGCGNDNAEMHGTNRGCLPYSVPQSHISEGVIGASSL